MDQATWTALALVLALLGAVASVVLWRRRGPAAGLRGLAWTLVPIALWLTRTLRLAADIVDAVGRWALHLVFSPFVWAGIVVAGLSGLLFAVSAAMRARGIGVRRRGRPVLRDGTDRAAIGRAGTKGSGGARRGRSSRTHGDAGHSPDEDMDEIEAILNRRGIR